MMCPYLESNFCAEDDIMHVTLQKRDKGQTWSSPIMGEGLLDPYTSDQEQKRLMLQRFQEEVLSPVLIINQIFLLMTTLLYHICLYIIYVCPYCSIWWWEFANIFTREESMLNCIPLSKWKVQFLLPISSPIHLSFRFKSKLTKVRSLLW